MGKLISIITCAYNEEKNIGLFYEQVCVSMESSSVEWELIAIDDHSIDRTWSILNELTKKDARVKIARLARNSGSHTAARCGLTYARGDCAVVIAADLQDPPETIPLLVDKWNQGAKIVWAVREQHEGETIVTKGFSCLYYWIMRHFVGINETPSAGADFFLIDRRVIDVLKAFKETHVSLLALLTWMGFRQERVLYVKKARKHGRSGWNLEKKLKLVVDSITSFTYKPIRMMSYIGFVTATVGFLYAINVICTCLFSDTKVPGYASLIVIVLLIGGLQMTMMGILGEYLWRALDEARNRPRFIVEDETDIVEEGKR